MDIVPNLTKYMAPLLILYRTCRSPVPVLMLYRTCRSIRYLYRSLYRYRRLRYPYRSEPTEVSGIGIDVPDLPTYPVPAIPAACLGTYRTEHTLLCILFKRYPLGYQLKICEKYKPGLFAGQIKPHGSGQVGSPDPTRPRPDPTRETFEISRPDPT